LTATAAPLLEEFGVPATNYVSTYYSAHQRPIPPVAVRYLLWRARDKELAPGTLPGLDAAASLRDPRQRERLADRLMEAPQDATSVPLIDGVAVAGRKRIVKSPIDGRIIGTVQEGDEALVAAAMAAAQAGFQAWNAKPVAERADVLLRAGDLIEQNRGRLALGEEGQQAGARDAVALGDLTGVMGDSDLEDVLC